MLFWLMLTETRCVIFLQFSNANKNQVFLSPNNIVFTYNIIHGLFFPIIFENSWSQMEENITKYIVEFLLMDY